MEKSQNLVFSVSDLIAVINQTFEYAYSDVFVEGEVSEYKVSQNKWVFFNIKDEQGTIGCFIPIWQLRTPIVDGMRVIVSAVPKLTNRGGFSLTVKSLRPSGEGSIKKSFDILKAKLDKEGLFLPERKRTLPLIPKHIAVISSIQAAGYADFIKIINDRWGGVHVDVANVQVQGNPAPDQIIKAIEYFNQAEILPEVIVIIRGGGSAEDLAVFNDEKLVRAIAASRIPTLLGVGHEIDESLADLAADVRAATPSNAAQILVPSKIEFIKSIRRQIKSTAPMIENQINQYVFVVNNYLIGAFNLSNSYIDTRLKNVAIIRQMISNLNPRDVLAKGYAIVRGSFQVGKDIEVETNKNIIIAEVKNVTSK